MPRLLKFSCQNCGTKLAVPISMAGMTDHCPKCNELVTSPQYTPPVETPKVEPPKVEAPVAPLPAAPPPVRAASPADGWSAAELKDAFHPGAPAPIVRPQEPSSEARPAPEILVSHHKASTPEERLSEERPQPLQKSVQAPAPEPQEPVPFKIGAGELTESNPDHSSPVPSSLFDEPPAEKEASLFARKEETTPPPTVEDKQDQTAPRSLLSSMLNAPKVAPRRTTSTTTPRAGSTTVDPMPSETSVEPVSAPLDLKDKGFGKPDESLADEEDETEENGAKARMPGMGEVLAAVTSSSLGTNREQQPWLAAPFLSVSDSTKQERKQKKRRKFLMMVLSFIMIDAVVVFVFKRQIVEWWHGHYEHPAEVSHGSETPVPPQAPEITGDKLKDPVEDKVPAAIPIPETKPTPPTSTPQPQASTPPGPKIEEPVTMESKSESAPVDPLSSTTPGLAASPLAEVPINMAAANTTPPGGLPPDTPPPSSTVVPVPPSVPVTAPTPRTLGKTPADAQSALMGLLQFLDAPNWKERAKVSQKASTLQTAMANHAEKYGDGPIVVGKVEFVERYVHTDKSTMPYCMFELSGGTLKHRLLALVEQPKSGPALVDWEGFMEFRHDYLLSFLETDTAPPQKFRVMLRRKHYFDKDVPDLLKKDGFQITQPNASYEGHVFIPKETALSKQMASQLGWDMDMPVIVELAWKTKGPNKWVEIASIPKFGWRS